MSTLDSIGQDISRTLQSNYQPLRWKDSYGVGGSGATANTVIAPNGEEFFVKRGGLASFQMLQAEFAGIQEIHNTHTIRVPKPICLGTNNYESYVVFEKVTTGGHGQPEVMAERLAAMHSKFAPNQMFGWKMDNTIGATYQPNSYSVSWSEFWDRNRLGHMLTLAKRDGANFPMEQELRNKVRYILSNHDCKPSLVHGDLWSGNQGFDRHGEPIIFDPAVYYGDREADIAMTKLFGSNARSFYETYDRLLPRPPGYELRETIYNLYHILNHFVLFGGSYLNESYRLIDRILKA
eukprot:gene3945-4317_t